MDGRGSGSDMDSRMYQDIFATEFVDMFPRTNGDILVHTILAGTGSWWPTSIRTYRAMLRRSCWCQGKINKGWKVAYFRAFCKVSIIREALRKARFSCMETYLLCSSTGEKVDDRKNAVGFRLWIRCSGLWHWDCCQKRPQFKSLDTKRQTWQWNK